MLQNKVLLISGGTGSFGTALIERLLNTDIGEIRVFSRDEEKQDAMRHKYSNERIRYYIGDVKDYESIESAMRGVDLVVHAAALKQVPSCEFFPIEAVKTNVLGTENLLLAAENARVSKVVCLSTDKAAYPINAMGASKALMEKVAVSHARMNRSGTVICCVRYGNVLCSRGSVVPLFIRQIEEGLPLTVTDPDMTRYVMTLENAVDLIRYAFEAGESGDLLVRKAPACKISVLAEAVRALFKADNEIKVIGIRHGEKLCETLLTAEECARGTDKGEYFAVPADRRDLNYDKRFTDGNRRGISLTEFNSDNAPRLELEQLKEKLLCVAEVRAALERAGAL